MQRIIFILFLFFANNVYSLTGTEGVSNPILDLGVGARALGMGGAFVAVCNDGNAGYWNPAGLSQILKFEIHSMYTSLFLGTKFYYLSLAVPLFRIKELIPKSETTQTNKPQILSPSLPLTIYIGWVESFVSGLKSTSDIIDPVTGQPYVRSDFTARDDAYLIAFGISVIKYFSLGVNTKIISRHLGYGKGFGIGFDTGILVKPINDLKFAFLIQDTGTTEMKWEYTEEGIKKHSKELVKSRLKWGVSFDFKRIFTEEIETKDEQTPDNSTSIINESKTFKTNKSIFGKSLISSLVLSTEFRWQVDWDSPAPVYYYIGMEYT